ncbi:MAG: hypothetical protein LIQ31_05210, partial [Planctomycetes bacterium]|nr:hypothetical protein [Planctomycetota bacterium]
CSCRQSQLFFFERSNGLHARASADRRLTNRAEDRVRTALARAADIARTTSRGIGIIVENAEDPSPFIRDVLASIPDSLPGIDRAWLVATDGALTVGHRLSQAEARSDPLLAMPLLMAVPYFEPSRRTGDGDPDGCSGLGAISYPIFANGGVAGVFGLDIDYAAIIPDFHATGSGTVPYLLSDSGDILLPACPPEGRRSVFEKFPGENFQRTFTDLLALRRTVSDVLPTGPGGRTRISLAPATPAGFGRTLYVYSETPGAPVPDGIDRRLAGYVLVGLVGLLGLIIYYQTLYRGLPGTTSDSGRYTVATAEPSEEAPLPDDIGVFTEKPPETKPIEKPVTRIRPRPAQTIDTESGVAVPAETGTPVETPTPPNGSVQNVTSDTSDTVGAFNTAACGDVEIHDGEPLAKLAREDNGLDLATGLGNVQCQKDVYEEMLRIAAASIPQTVEALMSAYATEDYERMGIEARSVGTSLELVGFGDLAGDAYLLETACHDNDVESIEAGLTGFLESLNRTRKTTERSFDAPPPVPGV